VRRPLTLVFLVALVVPLAAACGGDDDSTRTRDTRQGSPSLLGRSFVSTTVTEGGRPRPLAPRTELSLAVTPDGSIDAGAGCNHMSGGADIEPDRLIVTDLGTTDMGCDQTRMDQDTWFAGFLQAGPTYRLDGAELTLTAKGTVIRFTDRKVAHPDRPLAGTTWRIDGFVDGDVASSLPAGVVATLRIDGGRLAFANHGCNSGGADVRVTSRELTVGPLMTTQMACEPGPAEVEAKVGEVLRGTVAYRIESDGLTLTRGDHGITLVTKD
jgi:heat shock protein HslJ